MHSLVKQLSIIDRLFVIIVRVAVSDFRIEIDESVNKIR